MDTLTADPPVPADGASDQPDRSPSNRSVRPSGAPRPGTPEFEAWSGAIVDAGSTAGPTTPLRVGPAVSSDALAELEL
ncbi:MAG: hypothetical protein ACRDZ7_04620, partial [Acidimicrobiia bacterium]